MENNRIRLTLALAVLVSCIQLAGCQGDLFSGTAVAQEASPQSESALLIETDFPETVPIHEHRAISSSL